MRAPVPQEQEKEPHSLPLPDDLIVMTAGHHADGEPSAENSTGIVLPGEVRT
jgi:hypothetical protein